MKTVDDVTIELAPDGRHKALIAGEVIALLSPYRGNYAGGKKITSWRIVDAKTKLVDTSELSRHDSHDGQRIEQLRHAAVRLWRSRQPEARAEQAEKYRERRLEYARRDVRHAEEQLAKARAVLAEVEKEG